MIVGRAVHCPGSATFDEIDAAVSAISKRTVCFNAQIVPQFLSPLLLPLFVPDDAVIYNLENVPGQVDPGWFAGREVWDFSARSVRYARERGHLWTHVPIGYHPSMRRFQRKPRGERDIDVAFAGTMNERRQRVIDALSERGLRVVVIPSGMPWTYGSDRDSIYARTRLALNMLQFEEGLFPSLRAAHLIANGVPVLSERCHEPWDFVPLCAYEEIVPLAVKMLTGGDDGLDELAGLSDERFRARPLIVPG